MNLFEEYKTKNPHKRIFTSNRSSSIIKLKARAMTNTLEVTPFETTGDKTNSILRTSGFSKIRRKLGQGLSLYGEYAVGLLPIKDSFVIDAFRVTDYSMIGQMETMVEVESGSSFIVGKTPYPIYTKYHYVNNKPTISRYVKIPKLDETGNVTGDLDIVETEKDWVFKSSRLPVELFFNNEDNASDIEYSCVISALEELSYLDSKKVPEWNRTRTTPYYNENFTSPDLDPDKDTEQVDSGEKQNIVDEAYESKVNPGKQMIPATQGTTILQQNILFIEDDIYKKLGLKRDTTGGNNKHGLEIVLQDEFMVDELLALRTLREDHWKSFFSKMDELTGETNENITLKLSSLSQAKIDYLNANIAAEQAKAKNTQPVKGDG